MSDDDKAKLAELYDLCRQRTRAHEKAHALEAELKYAEARAEHDRMYELTEEIRKRIAAAKSEGWWEPQEGID